VPLQVSPLALTCYSFPARSVCEPLNHHSSVHLPLALTAGPGPCSPRPDGQRPGKVEDVHQGGRGHGRFRMYAGGQSRLRTFSSACPCINPPVCGWWGTLPPAIAEFKPLDATTNPSLVYKVGSHRSRLPPRAPFSSLPVLFAGGSVASPWAGGLAGI
jgi:hypothetical protein